VVERLFVHLGAMPRYIYVFVSEPSDNSALIELLAGITDRRIRRKVKKLVEFGSSAVRSLGELDSALYSRENGEDQLQIISDAVLSHVRRLLAYLASVAPKGTSGAVDQDIDVEFASGDSMDLTAAVAAVLEKHASDEVTASRAPNEVKSDEERWSELAGEMDSMQYGLGSELAELDRRFSEALKLDRKGQALRDLDDATNSLMDGVFAMMTTVYEVFLGNADPDRMIPGYRDTLGTALAVRRSTTELRQEVQELNRSIQDSETSPMVVEMSYNLLRESLMRFINNAVFSFLRAGDQQEFADFGERLSHGDATGKRLDCEGLDKYLDSLAVVSQRDVLLKHDSDLREKLFTDLESAIALTGTQPERVPAIVHDCFARAEHLFGLVEELDSLVYKWSTFSEEKRSNVREALGMGRILKRLVELPKKTPPPPVEGDFF
jgi:hypothetical protein